PSLSGARTGSAEGRPGGGDSGRCGAADLPGDSARSRRDQKHGDVSLRASSRVSACSGTARGDYVVSSEPAEYVHWKTDGGDAAGGVRARAADGSIATSAPLPRAGRAAASRRYPG